MIPHQYCSVSVESGLPRKVVLPFNVPVAPALFICKGREGSRIIGGKGFRNVLFRHWLTFFSFSRYNDFVFRVSTPVKICLSPFLDWRTAILFTMLLTTYSFPFKRLSKMSPSFMVVISFSDYWRSIHVFFWLPFDEPEAPAFWTTLTFCFKDDLYPSLGVRPVMKISGMLVFDWVELDPIWIFCYSIPTPESCI